MILTLMTTTTDLLASGASVEGSAGESLTELMAVTKIDREWIHDLPVQTLLARDAVINLSNGLSLRRNGFNVDLMDDFDNELIGTFDMTDEGFAEMSDAVFMADMSPVMASSASLPQMSIA